jgi:hypothetical protein
MNCASMMSTKPGESCIESNRMQSWFWRYFKKPLSKHPNKSLIHASAGLLTTLSWRLTLNEQPKQRSEKKRRSKVEKTKQIALEQAGYHVGSAEDFLELSPEEAAFVELRLRVSRGIRTLREKCHLTQQELGRKLRSSQSRVAKMEAATNDVSLDLLFRGFFALGGSVHDLIKRPRIEKGKSKPRPGKHIGQVPKNRT